MFLFEMIVAGILFNVIGIDESSHKLNDLMDQMSFIQIFILAVLVAPLIEEICFRYYLCKPDVLILGLPLLLIFYSIYNLNLGTGDVLSFSFLLAVALAVFILIILKTSIRDKLRIGFTNYYPYVFYFSAVIFAYVHIFNFHDGMPWYYTPILVFPQFMIGLYLGYVRVRNGMPYCILIHAVNNAIPMLILLVTPDSILVQQ